MGDSDIYIVERLLAKRKHQGVTQYLIKWRNYPLKASTWEPVENIMDRNLITAFESSSKSKPSLSASSTTSSSSTASSTNTTTSPNLTTSRRPIKKESRRTSSLSSSSSPAISKRGRGRPRKNYLQQREEQVRLQRHIEQQQQPNQHTTQITRVEPEVLKYHGINPPIGTVPAVEEIVYEPKLTKDPILVTDVTAKDLTVTISECKTPDGFFISQSRM